MKKFTAPLFLILAITGIYLVNASANKRIAEIERNSITQLYKERSQIELVGEKVAVFEEQISLLEKMVGSNIKTLHILEIDETPEVFYYRIKNSKRIVFALEVRETPSEIDAAVDSALNEILLYIETLGDRSSITLPDLQQVKQIASQKKDTIWKNIQDKRNILLKKQVEEWNRISQITWETLPPATIEQYRKDDWIKHN